jgi:hypothetical protein
VIPRANIPAWRKSPGASRLAQIAWRKSPGASRLAQVAWRKSPGANRLAQIAWRKSALWPDNNQLEQDLVISRALVELFERPVAGDFVGSWKKPA